MTAKINYFEEEASIIKAITKRIIDICKKKESVCRVALSGGSTPLQLFKYWRTQGNIFASLNIEFYWVDERMVPYESSESNYGAALRACMKELGLSDEKCFPIPVSNSPESNAKLYNNLLRGKIFDICILGMGNDGHTSSVFPYSKSAYLSNDPYVVTEKQENKQKRVGMSLSGIGELSRHIFFQIQGEDKKAMLEQVWNQAYDESIENITIAPAAYIMRKYANKCELFTNINL